MAIAITLNEYLDKEHVHFEHVEHRRTQTSLDSSRSAHLPAARVSKAVVLQDDDGEYLMASLPANKRVSLAEVDNLMGKNYHLVSERKLQDLFPDCVKGAIPAIGRAYHMPMLVDDSLLSAEPVYIESGDHENLLKLNASEYAKLVSKAPHGNIQGANMGAPRLWERSSRDRWV